MEYRILLVVLVVVLAIVAMTGGSPLTVAALAHSAVTLVRGMTTKEVIPAKK